MAAMVVTPFAPGVGQIGSSTGTIVMAIAVAWVGTLVVGTGLVATYIFDAQARSDTRRRLPELLESNIDGMAIVQVGAITATNAAFAALVGEGTPIVGQPLSR